MEKKRENILFPLGFNSLSVTAIAYNMRLKNEINEELDKKLAEMRKELESEYQEKLEKMRKEIYNDLYEQITEKLRHHDDGWESIDEK